MDSKKVFLWVLILFTLIGAFIFGKSNALVSQKNLLRQNFPDYDIETVNATNDIYKISNAIDTFYLKTDVAVGYGGKMIVGTLVTNEASIEEVVLLHHTETVSYINKIKNKSFFHQFKLKKVWEPFVTDHDVEAVSGATISSVAITKAAKTSSHYLSINQFDTKPEIIKSRFRVANYDWGIFVFFLISIVLTFWLKKRIFKTITLVASILLLGFMWNASLSVSFFTRIFLGEIPSLSEGLLFWLFMVFLAGGILVLKRNFYCYSICPFYGVQYFLSKLTGQKWGLHPKVRQYSHYVNGGILWFALIIALLKNNAPLSSYEPFSMFFSLQGDGVQWFIFPLLIIGSMFVSQFFCRYFCPIGVISKYSLQARKGSLFAKGKKPVAHKRTISKAQMVQFGIVTLLYVLSVLAILYYLVLNLMQ